MNCELLIKGADVVTMEADLPVAAWVAVDNGKIKAVGVGDDCPTDVVKSSPSPGVPSCPVSSILTCTVP